MTSHNQRVGAWGEDSAARYVENRGYQVIARNIRTPYGEIDIVAKLNDVHIFIEVKTLTSSKNFYPEHNITARKREHMTNAALHYATENEINQWQIDVIAVEGQPGKDPIFTHFENVV